MVLVFRLLVQPALAVCGDMYIDPGEYCDDGGTVDGDGCSSTCQSEYGVCGDGNIDVHPPYANEQCDDGNTVREVLPYGQTTGCTQCDEECVIFDACSWCGDGALDYAEGERCDDGNTLDGDCCSSVCQPPPSTCGDGVVDPATACRPAEACDDGNLIAGDGCSSTCQHDCGAWTGVLEPIAIRPSETVVVDGFIRNDANISCDASLRAATGAQLTLLPGSAPGTKWHLRSTTSTRTVAPHQVVLLDFVMTATATIDGTAPHGFAALPGVESTISPFGNTAWVVPLGETTTFDGWDTVDAIGDFMATLDPATVTFTNSVNPQDARIVYESFDPTQSVDSCYYPGSYYAEVHQPTAQSGGWWVDDPLAPNTWGPDRVGVVPQFNDVITWYRGGPFTPEQQACITSGNCVAPPPLNPSCGMVFLQKMAISCLNFPMEYRDKIYESHALGQDFTTTEHTVYRDDAPPETRAWP